MIINKQKLIVRTIRHVLLHYLFPSETVETLKIEVKVIFTI